jgi:hypothetical protein
LARETGWSEHYIIWELPLARLLQYQHCALRANDVWTVPPGPPTGETVDAFERMAALTEMFSAE